MEDGRVIREESRDMAKRVPHVHEAHGESTDLTEEDVTLGFWEICQS